MLDPAIHEPANSVQLPNRIGSSIRGYGRWEDRRASGFWASKQVDDDYDDDGDSGICSPPLWKTNPTRSPQFDRNYYQSLSPSSRTQAIARGQRELMEMVRNMPESTYELTLKDLVEKTAVEEGEENEKEEKSLINKNAYRREGSGSSSGRKVDQRTAARRSGNVHRGGFYLKMMMVPPSLLSKKKKNRKKSESSGNEGSKATLRPSMSEGSLKGIVDKEWWKKSPAASGDSESVATSSMNSGSTKSSGGSSSDSSRSSSRRERSVGGCWFLIGKPRRLLTRE